MSLSCRKQVLENGLNKEELVGDNVKRASWVQTLESFRDLDQKFEF